MRRTGNRGQVLLVFLGALLALLGVAALGIDVGYLYTVRHELQRCTDAGALAGASAFLSGNWSDGATRAVADGRARAFATKDKVATTILSAGSEIAVAFPAQDRVRVDATRNVNLFFARLFLGPTKTVTAYSIAEASVVDTNVTGLKPWGIPFPWEDTNGNDLFDPGETVHKDCPEGVAGPVALLLPGNAGDPEDRHAAEHPQEPERPPLPAAGARPLLRPRLRRLRRRRLPGGDRGRERLSRSAWGIPSRWKPGTWWVPRSRGQERFWTRTRTRSGTRRRPSRRATGSMPTTAPG